MLRAIFCQLNVMYLKINRSFGILIVSLAATSFVIICQKFYTFYRLTEATGSLNVFEAFYSALWVILHFGRIFGILYQNSKVEDEVGRYKSILPIIASMNSNLPHIYLN